MSSLLCSNENENEDEDCLRDASLGENMTQEYSPTEI